MNLKQLIRQTVKGQPWLKSRVFIARHAHHGFLLHMRRIIGRGGAALLSVQIRVRRGLRRPDGPRRVLFLGHNLLMAQAVLRGWATIRENKRVRATLVMPWAFRRTGKLLAREAGIRFAPGLGWARVWAWDLVVVATHVKPFHPLIPVARMLHGIGSSSKVVGGREFTYGRSRVLRPNGRSVYATILESSVSTAQEVVTRLPALQDHVTVTGSLVIDELLARQASRADARKKMGFEPSDRVIAVMSTFGPFSLMETVGRAMMEEMRELTEEGRFRFILCTHPNLWAIHRRTERPWDAFLRGLRDHGIHVLEPGDDWIDALIVADAATSDHTSLSTAFALLGKPLGFVPVNGSIIDPASTVARLIHVAPRISDVLEFGSFLNCLLASRPNPQEKAIAEEAISYLGEGGDRTRAALLRLLGLDSSIASHNHGRGRALRLEESLKRIPPKADDQDAVELWSRHH